MRFGIGVGVSQIPTFVVKAPLSNVLAFEVDLYSIQIDG